MWPAADVIIIGGGPSFKQADWGVLREFSLSEKIKVIGVNKAYKDIPDSNDWMHVLWFGDSPFYALYRTMKDRGLYSFTGLRACCCSHAATDKAIKYVDRQRGRKDMGLSTDPKTVRWNGNSGGSAINLAYHLTGPEGRAFLFGFDACSGADGATHWHEGYKEVRKFTNSDTKQKFYERLIRTTHEIAKAARSLGYTIINVNPDSAILDFPRISFDEFVQIIQNKKKMPPQSDSLTITPINQRNHPVEVVEAKKSRRREKMSKKIWDVTKGDKFMVLDANGDLIRGVSWADEERQVYMQLYVHNINIPLTSKRDARCSIWEKYGPFTVVPLGNQLTRVDLLNQLIRQYQWTIGAEVGVAQGKTTFALIHDNPGLQMIAVDKWPGGFSKMEPKFRHKLNRNSGGRVTLINKLSLDGANDIEDESLDFVFIDADHSYEACSSDIKAYLPKVKPEGMILGHDANWDGVRKAYNECLVKVTIFHPDAVWMTWKKDQVGSQVEEVVVDQD